VTSVVERWRWLPSRPVETLSRWKSSTQTESSPPTSCPPRSVCRTSIDQYALCTNPQPRISATVSVVYLFFSFLSVLYVCNTSMYTLKCFSHFLLICKKLVFNFPILTVSVYVVFCLLCSAIAISLLNFIINRLLKKREEDGD